MKYHGESKGALEQAGTASPEYRAWQNMKTRCLNPRGDDYPRYGARGITVCAEWLHDFAAFLAFVGRRPSPKHTLERIDNDKGYQPGNVKWATRSEQARNRRTTRKVEYRGETASLKTFAERFGLKLHTVMRRLNEGWTVAEALETPAAPWRRKRTARQPEEWETI